MSRISTIFRRGELPVYLRATKGPDAGRRYSLTADRTVLGRHPDCDIVIDFGAVSRQHAHIVRVGQSFFVEDLRSRNGTYVNDEAITGRHLLKNGDKLRICDLTFAFADRDPQERPQFGADDSSMAILVDDVSTQGTSTIMSKLGIGLGSSHVRVEANPQVKLRALLEINQSLSKALALDEVLPKVLDSLFKIFLQADRGFVVLKLPNGAIAPKAVKFRRPEHGDTIRVSRTVVDQVMTNREAILSADAASDARFEMAQSIADFRIRSMMCAPLLDSEGTALGVIQIDTQDQRGRFKEEDLEVLAGVAAQAGIAIENAQLHEQALEQQAVHRDLEMAHRVQQGLLPSAPPAVPGYYFFDFYEPAKAVGGDFYDYIELPDGRIAVVLADVSGKGVSAALLMARVSSEVRFCLATSATPAVAMNKLNASFCRSGWDDRFVTMVLVVFDPENQQAIVVNAGHMPPLVRRASGVCAALSDERSGLPLGVDPEHGYQELTETLAPGDCFVAFTDGFSEAMNAQGELYGIRRLIDVMNRPADDPSQLGRLILTDVRKFVGGHPQSDDMCLVLVGRLDGSLA